MENECIFEIVLLLIKETEKLSNIFYSLTHGKVVLL